MPDIPKTPKIKQKQGFKKMALRIDWALQLPTRKRQQLSNQVPPGVTCLHLLALLDMSRCMKFSRTQPHSSTLLTQKKGNGQNVRVPPWWSEREETASRNVLCLGIGGGLYQAPTAAITLRTRQRIITVQIGGVRIAESNIWNRKMLNFMA